MRIQDVVTVARSPWQNAYVKRFIGSLRRECLDHVTVLNAAGLQRLLRVSRSVREARAAAYRIADRRAERART